MKSLALVLLLAGCGLGSTVGGIAGNAVGSVIGGAADLVTRAAPPMSQPAN